MLDSQVISYALVLLEKTACSNVVVFRILIIFVFYDHASKRCWKTTFYIDLFMKMGDL